MKLFFGNIAKLFLLIIRNTNIKIKHFFKFIANAFFFSTGLSGELNGVSTSCSNYAKYYARSLPVLEDGLSSGHTSDTENNNNNNLNNNLHQGNHINSTISGGSNGGISMLMDMKKLPTDTNNIENKRNSISPNILLDTYTSNKVSNITNGITKESNGLDSVRSKRDMRDHELLGQSPSNHSKVFKNIDPELDSLYSISMIY